MAGRVPIEDTAGRDKPGRLTRLADGVMAAANVTATAWILVIMVLILGDVLGRNLFLHPIAGVPEMVKFSIVGIVFLQISHTHRRGEMIRSDGILGLVSERRPRLGAAMDLGAQLCGVAMSLALAWAVWPKATRAFRRDEMEGIAGHFQMPVWPFLVIVTFGSLLLALSFALEAARAAKRMQRGQ
ncbi:TRAP transporter small permease subunit [Roseibium sp.]|uniref:TRAP transporter small permease subunit n=1 Tax=Roseibium sp. TaxID=1936156 RepID=UPI003A9773F9